MAPALRVACDRRFSDQRRSAPSQSPSQRCQRQLRTAQARAGRVVQSSARSIAGRQTLGRRKGSKLERIGADPHAPWVDTCGPLQAAVDGFDLHAALTVQSQRPEGRLALEKLLRYCARPPIADDRLEKLADGRIALRLKTPWHDGTTHVLYEPLDLVAKLAALVPRPHKNLVLYHGVLSANADWRPRVVAYRGTDSAADADTAAATSISQDASSPARVLEPARHRWQWAELMQRAFGYELLECPKCGGKMRLLAVVLQPAAIRKILGHVGLPSGPPTPAQARASPTPDSECDVPIDDVA